MFARPRRWLVAWTVIVLSLILAILGTTVYASFSTTLYAEVDLNLQRRGDEVAVDLHELSATALQADRTGYRGGLFYILLGSDGEVVANPQSVALSSWLPSLSFSGSAVNQSGVINGEPVRLYLRPIFFGRVPVGVLIVGQSVAVEQAALHGLLFVLILGGAFGLLLSLAGAWFLSGRALVPIKYAFARQQEFVADASHELRTPLTILRSTVDLLNHHRTEPLEANAELFDDMRSEVQRMERLTTDLLTLARQDLGQMDLAVGGVDLAALAGDTVRRLMPLAMDRGISLATESDEGPHMAEVDPDRIEEVLLIILDNALKHTPAGGSITVSTKRRGSQVALSVTDTGEGIPPEHLRRVFDRFYRVDRARSRAQGGTGLGLAIAKQIVEAHGGQLAISSTVGAGTTVTMRLHSSGAARSLADRVGRIAARVAHRPAGQ